MTFRPTGARSTVGIERGTEDRAIARGFPFRVFCFLVEGFVNDEKPFWQSKIFWLNVVWVIGQLIVKLPEWLGEPGFEPGNEVATIVGMAIALLTVIFRLFFTKKTLTR